MKERSLIKFLTKAACYITPLPSAYIVTVSAMSHLGLPLVVAAFIGGAVELLGLSTIYVALWQQTWNETKRKTDQKAPVWLSLVLVAVYMAATVGLSVVLKAHTDWAVYAPILLPAMTLVAGLNLALIDQQERRERWVKEEKEERQTARQLAKLTAGPAQFAHDAQNAHAGVQNQHRELLDIYRIDPKARQTQVARQLGVHRNTVRNWLDELEKNRVIRRNGTGVEVLQ